MSKVTKSRLLGREVVVVEAARTAIGRGHATKGAFRDVHPNVLLGTVYRAVVERAGIDPSVVDDVLAGAVDQVGEQSNNIARNAWLQAGLPVTTPAITVDRACGSAQSAVALAAALIASGQHDVVIGAGVEHMGRIPMGANAAHPEEFGVPYPPELLERYALVPQGIAAERIAERWGISRREQDELGLRSHRLAVQAVAEGRFDREIVGVETPDGLVTTDQGPRADTSIEKLAALKPAFLPEGTVTAGNASQISDGAAAVLLMSREKADELGLRPRARIADALTVGVDPVLMLTGPIPATQELLRRNGLGVGDVDRYEINEAFASVVGAWQRELHPDLDRVNVGGGAMALGHPLGSSGARLITTILHELERSDTELGLVTMCTAGGTGTGTLLQRL
ncbi:thiolase family protein [Patulibacter sp.]|uniref:thiolase family protein n=1 Tax=Patulibacter sp. TaxID=1912859 RepID=UPI00271A8CA5|nr:thiolase family protein [Patulibacter sp.]MDO9406898.1 thiolase family protein [Patulibacter sp.]